MRILVAEDEKDLADALALPGGPTWTEGVVSYLGRSIEESNNVALDDLIQTDSSIASGVENIGFAISTDTAIDTVYSLVTKASGSSPWLGVNTTTVTKSVKTQCGLSVDSGALVASLVSGGPAATAGLRTYDVITRIDDTDIGTSQELGTAIQSCSAGDKATITYRRGQTTMTTAATWGQKPSG